MSIPKIIHYCWFGENPLPELAQKCITSWKKYCPDYEIKEWNESNFDLNCCDYVQEAYGAKKWAFVSDVARLSIVYQYGGVYLDTDVELLKPLDKLLEMPAFFGAEADSLINTGLGFGAEKGNNIVRALLDDYSGLHFRKEDGTFDTTACPKRNTCVFEKAGYSTSEKQIWCTKDATVFPPEYFCPVNYKTGHTEITPLAYSIHHYSESWLSEQEKYHVRLTRKITNTVPFLSHKNGSLIAQFIAVWKYQGLSAAVDEGLAWVKRQ